ncbi:MAG: hypothetical protein LKG27_07685 [Clostridiaceae bacterium]|jgi:Spy/CpxP family protein refolding chaperone|nr:hypothetical protein [Clostridiaceae bacterium]
MKKIVLYLILTLLVMPSVCAKQIESRTNAKTCTQPEMSEVFRMEHAQRAVTYNVLNLTDSQIQTKNKIDQTRYNALQPQFDQLDQELFVLRKLEAGNASKQAIKKQKKVVKNLQKNIEKTDAKYDKEFKNSLSREQRSKYKDVRRLENRDLKRKMHETKDPYYDKNMRVFGEG